jgi:Pyridoxamine 5'-phosphate oxidase
MNADVARAILDGNLYMVLATADADGRPWAAPVYFAHVDYRELLWVSAPETRHSRNLAARPELGIVVFDSSVPIYTGQAVYMEARAPAARRTAGERRTLGGARPGADDLLRRLPRLPHPPAVRRHPRGRSARQGPAADPPGPPGA